MILDHTSGVDSRRHSEVDGLVFGDASGKAPSCARSVTTFSPNNLAVSGPEHLSEAAARCLVAAQFTSGGMVKSIEIYRACAFSADPDNDPAVCYHFCDEYCGPAFARPPSAPAGQFAPIGYHL